MKSLRTTGRKQQLRRGTMSRGSRAALAGLLLYGAIHFLPRDGHSLFPYFWGVHFASLLSTGQVAFAIAISLFAALFSLLPEDQRAKLFPDDRRTRLLATSSMIALFLALVMFLPIRTAFLGDGYLVTTEIRDLAERGIRASNFSDALARQFLSARILAWLGEVGGAGGSGEFAFRGAGLIGAMLFAASAILFARRRGAAGPFRISVLPPLFSLPLCALFFGYVESYAIFAGAFLFCAALLGELYSRISLPDSTICRLREALAAREDASALGLLGYAFAQKRAWDSAAWYAERSIRADPEGYYGYYAKGFAAQACGDGAGMIAACGRILQCDGVPPEIRRSAEEVLARSRGGN